MSTEYRELLEGVVQHLEDLKRRGVQYLPLDLQTLAALEAPPRRPARRLSPRPPKPEHPAPALARSAPPPPGSANISDKPELALDSPPASNVALTPEAKAAALGELRDRALGCRKCPHLASSRKNVVFGVGNVHAELMFVGEAPGVDEDVQGEPFVGRAGQLLTRIIQTMGFSRETVYIANILKCRPDTPGQTAGNRKPTADEMKTCFPYLLAQIDLIRPKVMVALGATAVEGLLGLTTGITKLRGHFQVFRGIPVMPTYHPSYLLRNAALSVKREVWEDMLQVLEKLGAPISEKQRNYFLKGP